MNLAELSIEDFDALVTGHLSHYAIWYEEIYNLVISNYFSNSDHEKMDFFLDIFIKSNLLNAEKKEQIFKKIVSNLFKESEFTDFENLFKSLAKFRKLRNLLAHGILDKDLSSQKPVKIHVFSSKTDYEETITAERFDQLLNESSALLSTLESLLDHIKVKLKK